MGTVVAGALQWGIAKLDLHFDTPISISIFVGTNLNGQTLNIVRSEDNQTWTSSGIVLPTCVVANGFCNFQATEASYYATYQTVAVQTQTTTGGGGGGGGGGASAAAATTPTTTTAKFGDIEFSIMMAQWGQTGQNLSADLNKDGVVDELDFSLLMANWGS